MAQTFGTGCREPGGTELAQGPERHCSRVTAGAVYRLLDTTRAYASESLGLVLVVAACPVALLVGDIEAATLRRHVAQHFRNPRHRPVRYRGQLFQRCGARLPGQPVIVCYLRLFEPLTPTTRISARDSSADQPAARRYAPPRDRLLHGLQ